VGARGSKSVAKARGSSSVVKERGRGVWWEQGEAAVW